MRLRVEGERKSDKKKQSRRKRGGEKKQRERRLNSDFCFLCLCVTVTPKHAEELLEKTFSTPNPRRHSSKKARVCG